jgi:hypothetical protein
MIADAIGKGFNNDRMVRGCRFSQGEIGFGLHYIQRVWSYSFFINTPRKKT